MKFYKQKYLHDPGNGVIGDCYRTAIGCILEIDPMELPHNWEFQT